MKKVAKKAAKKAAKRPARSPAKKVATKSAKPAPGKAAMKKAPAKKAAAKKPAARKAAPTKPILSAARSAAKASVPKASAPRPVAVAKPAGPSPIPEGFRTVTPYLSIQGAARAIDFYKQGLGAVEIMRMEAPNGLLGHAELRIGDSMVMLADEWPGMYTKAPTSLGGATSSIMLYVPDVDAFMAHAVRAGATVTQPPADMFWGDRFGKLRDPFGHEWAVATHVEDVAPAEMGRRMAEAMKSMSPPPAQEPRPDDDEPPEAA